MKKRILALFLCVLMAVSQLPASVLAGEALTGTVTISGEATYSETLTAVTESNATSFSYQWYRSDEENFEEIDGATSNEYTLTADDIGHTVKVVVSDSEDGENKKTGTIESTPTAAVAKLAAPAAPNVIGKACITGENNDGGISGTTAAMEYSTDSSFTAPITCSETLTTVTAAGDYYVRYTTDSTVQETGKVTKVTVAAYDAAAPDYVCQVTKDSEPVNAVSNGIAIGTDGKYETLQAAIDVVPTTGDEYTITMLKDFEYEGVEIAKTTYGQKIVLDLAGYDITLKVNKDATSSVITNLGDLTLMDSTDTDKDGEACGVVSNYFADGIHPGGYGGDWQTYNYTTSLFINKGIFTMNSGALRNTGSGSICYGFDNLDNFAGHQVTLNIHGGKIVSEHTAAIRFGNGVPNAILNMDGGWVESGSVSSIWLQCSNAPTMTMNISGGTLVGYEGVSYGIYDTGNSSHVTYNISGGTFTGSKALYTNGANVYISGGTFNGDVVLKQDYEGTTLKITGGKFDGRVTSYGTYAKTGFIYGGQFNDAKNYDPSATYYFDEDDLAYTLTTAFTQLSAESEEEYKTPKDYLDAGYILHLKAGVYGYLLDDNGKWVYEDPDGKYWYYNGYDEVGSYYYYRYIDGDGNEWKYGDEGYDAFDDSLDYVYLHLGKFNVYRDKGNAQGVELVDTIYAVQENDYYMTDAEKKTYLYKEEDVFSKVRFYAAGNYHSADTYATYPNKGKSGGAWGYVFCENYTMASSLAYSSYYLYSAYVPEDWVSWEWISSVGAFNLTNYWKKVYTCEYQGLYTDTSTNTTYKMYSVYAAGEVDLFADGYTDKEDAGDSAYYDVVPAEIDLGKAVVSTEGDVGEEVTVIKVKNETIDVDLTNGTNEDEDDDIDADVAASLITNTLKNSAVSGFLDTNIGTAIVDETKAEEASVQQNDVLKTLLKATDEAKDDTIAKNNIDETDLENIKTRVNVDLTSTVVAEMELAATSATITSATFDVKPIVKVTVENGDGDETTYEAVIPNEEIHSPITFRLPVASNISASAVEVFHSDTKGVKGTSKGYYPVQQTESGLKFVELSASSFSYYTYEILDTVANAVVVIRDAAGNTRGFTGDTAFAEAVDSYGSAGNEDDAEIILMENVTVSDTVTDNDFVDFNNKELTIDLNGYKLKGNSLQSDNVTVKNSDSNKHTLYATGTYANDISAFVAEDGYYVASTTKDNDTVKKVTNADYTVTVTAETPTDRDADTAGIDVFAGDYVSVTVKVTGKRFVAADVTLTYDKDKFSLVSAPASGWDGDYDYADMSEDGEDPTGVTRFYNAKTGSGYYEDGTVIGTFLFEAIAQESNNVQGDFEISDTDTYVASAWSEGWSTSAAAKVDVGNLHDDSAKIILKNMTASVTAKSGLVYTATEKTLLDDGYTAKDNTTGKAITDAAIKYCVLTKTEVDGTLYTGAAGQTQSTSNSAYVEGKEPKTPTEYTTTNPTVTAAGDYVVFYEISKPGYVTVSDSVNVSVAKANTTITWSALGGALVTKGTTTDGTGALVDADYMVKYNGSVFAAPTGQYDSLESNQKANATITMTSRPDAAEADVMKQTGTYVFTASISDNYNIENPTYTVRVDGGKITGYDLTNTTEGSAVWYDAAAHTLGVKTVADNATPAGATVQYSLNGTTWTDTIPEVTNVGSYTLTMKVSADGYYDFTDTVSFEVKNVEYKVEKTDYVTGWDLVLVYTNDAVPGFTYNGKLMFKVGDLGYKYGTTWASDGKTVISEGTTYTYVYGIVIQGDADITKVVPSNTAATTIDRTHTQNRYDTNNSNSVDINDLVVTQGVYNVGADFMNDTQMSIVLRADVSGNKKVDTYDCNLVKLNTNKA